LAAYDAYLSGKLVDYKFSEEEMKKALKAIEGLPKP
jgi:tryptophan synthase beta chain